MKKVEETITEILQIFTRSHEPSNHDDFTSLEVYRVKLIDAVAKYGDIRYRQGKGVANYKPIPSYIKHGVNFLNSQIAKKEQDGK